MATDLAARLRAVVEERLAVARAATPGPWRAQGFVNGEQGWWVIARQAFEIASVGADLGDCENAEHIALNDPADAILACERDLWVLDQHRWVAAGVNCGCDLAMCSCGEHVPWPC